MDLVYEAVRKGTVTLKDNADGKSDCWIKFKLVETADGASVFGWAASADCQCSIKFKSKSVDGTVKLYGTKNMSDHMKSCYSSSGRQTTIRPTSFLKRVPGIESSQNLKRQP